MIEKDFSLDCSSCKFCYRDKKYNKYCEKYWLKLPSWDPGIFCYSYEYRVKKRNSEDVWIHEQRMTRVDEANRLFEKYRPYATRMDTLYQAEPYGWVYGKRMVEPLYRFDELEPWDGTLPED